MDRMPTEARLGHSLVQSVFDVLQIFLIASATALFGGAAYVIWRAILSE